MNWWFCFAFFHFLCMQAKHSESTVLGTNWHDLSVQVIFIEHLNFVAFPCKIILGILTEPYNMPQHMNEFEAPGELWCLVCTSVWKTSFPSGPIIFFYSVNSQVYSKYLEFVRAQKGMADFVVKNSLHCLILGLFSKSNFKSNPYM